MPRGLGDDPLSRPRRGRAATAQGPTTGTVTVEGQSSAQAVVVEAEPAIELSASSAQSRSYNDVFFQRRSDLDGVADVKVSDAIAEPGLAAPVAPTQEVTALVVLAEAPLLESNEARVEIEPTSVIESQPEHPAEAQPIQPEALNGGFFQRVFGRFRKS